MVSGRCLILDDIRGMGLIMININEAIINQYDTTDHEMKNMGVSWWFTQQFLLLYHALPILVPYLSSGFSSPGPVLQGCYLSSGGHVNFDALDTCVGHTGDPGNHGSLWMCPCFTWRISCKIVP